jgi:membrane protein implicated in regulation of membrane protease activity
MNLMFGMFRTATHSIFEPTAIRRLPNRIPAVLETVDGQDLRVELAGTTWPAKLMAASCKESRLAPGQACKVVAIEGTMTLLIEL